MRINGINGANTQMGQMGMNQATDAYSRNIQDQIAKAQKQLQELSSNEDMTLEEKMKKRQEIQQKINDLNMQLKQHQMEQRRAAQNRSKKQQAKNSSANDLSCGTSKAESKNTGLSQTSMTAMISAGSSIKQAKVQGSVATEMKGKAGVLYSEIKLDKVRGNDTQAKEEELAKVERKAQAATASQLYALADASRTMKEAAQAGSETEKVDSNTEKADSNMEKPDSNTEKAGNKTEKPDKKTENSDSKDTGVKGKDSEESVSSTEEQKENVFTAESVNTRSENSASGSIQTNGVATAPRLTAYTPVDIRL